MDTTCSKQTKKDQENMTELKTMVMSLATKMSEIKVSTVGTAGPATPNTKLKNILKTGGKIVSIVSILKKKSQLELRKRMI